MNRIAWRTRDYGSSCRLSDFSARGSSYADAPVPADDSKLYPAIHAKPSGRATAAAIREGIGFGSNRGSGWAFASA